MKLQKMSSFSRISKVLFACTLVLTPYVQAENGPRFNFFNNNQEDVVENYLRSRSRTGDLSPMMMAAPAPVAAAAPAPPPYEAAPAPATSSNREAMSPRDRDARQTPFAAAAAAPAVPPPALFAVPSAQEQAEQRLEQARVSSEFQCDLFSDQSPMHSLSQSLGEMINVFKAEPECRPYVQQIEQVDQNATNLQTIFQSARQTLANGVSNTQEIMNAQNIALQLLQGARQNITNLIPSLSPECRAKLSTRAHLVKGVSDFALNLTPWILRLASVSPATQMAGQIVSGATTMVASVTSQLADENIRNSINMSVRENRINLAQNVCQYYKISRRFKLLTLNADDDITVFEQTLSKYIEQYLRQTERLDSRVASELNEFWTAYNSTFRTPSRLRSSQFISEENLFRPLTDLNRITSGNQCLLLVRNKLRQSQSTELRQFRNALESAGSLLRLVGQDNEDLTQSFTENRMNDLVTQFQQSLDQLRNVQGAEQLTQCRALVTQFTTEWKNASEELIGFYEIIRAMLTEDLDKNPSLKAHYENIERFRSQIANLEEEKKLANQAKTQDTSFAKSEINEKMNVLRQKLLSAGGLFGGSNPIESWMTYKVNTFERLYQELLASLREIERISLQFAGGIPRYQPGQIAGNAIQMSVILAYRNSSIDQITARKIGDNQYLKTQVCANLSHTMNKSQQLLNELNAMKMMCQYIENDLNQTTSATLRSNCLGQMRVYAGQNQTMSPLFLQLASRLDQNNMNAEQSIQQAIRSVQSKFRELGCSY